jgi:hypothetical protein
MDDERSTDLLSSLPRTRPHRRSDKRGARKPPATRKPASGKPAAHNPPAAKRLRQPAQPRGIPDARRAPKRKPAPAAAPEIVGTAVQAIGELAEIGLTLTARALRNAVSRLPKP